MNDQEFSAFLSGLDQGRANLTQAANTNPDQYAKDRQTALETGLPLPVVQNSPQLAQQQRMSQLDALRVVNPATYKLVSSVDNAKLAHDDLPNLTNAENVVNSLNRGLLGLKQTPQVFTIASANMSKGELEARFQKVDAALARGHSIRNALITYTRTLPGDVSDAELLRQYEAQKKQLAAEYPQVVAGAAQNIAKLEIEKRQYPQPAIMREVAGAQGWGDTLRAIGKHPLDVMLSVGPESMVQSLPGMVASVPAGLTAGPAGVGSAMGANSYATDYANSLMEALGRNGVDITDPAQVAAAIQNKALFDKANKEARAHATVVSLFDAVSGGVASRIALPTKLADKLVEKPLARELANLAVQTPVQATLGAAGEAGGQLAAGQDLKPADIILEALGEGFGAPAEVVTATISTRMQENQRKAVVAESQAQSVQELTQLAKDSKVRQRDPSVFAEMVDHATENEAAQHVYIAAEQLAQSGVAEQVMEASPAVAAQYEEALAIGGDIRIPVSEFAAYVAPQDFAQPLLDHIKADPDGFTPAEAADYRQNQQAIVQQEVEQALAENDNAAQFAQLKEEVKNAVVSELESTGRFRKEVNDAYATLQAEFYAVQGARMGVSPVQLFEQMPLKVKASGLLTDALAQANAQQPAAPEAQPGQAQPAGAQDSVNPAPQGAQPVVQRGAYSPSTNTITLLADADFSTFLHESGHQFLEMQTAMATQLLSKPDLTPGEQEIVFDTNLLMQQFGTTLDAWNRMTLDQQRPYHEQFAEWFEEYLFSGKSPSVQLQPLFQRFRAWLIAVYKRFKASGVQLSDDVRGVMDRMLASSEHIKEAEFARGMAPMFETPEQAGMSPEEFAKYHEQAVEATLDATQGLQERSLRDLRWVHNAHSKAVKRLQKEAEALRAEVRQEVTAEVDAQPVYRADQYIRHGKLTLSDNASQQERRFASEPAESTKLSLAALKEMYGTEANAIWRQLPTGKYGLAAVEGWHPDVLAEMFGFTSGDQMVRELLAATPREQEIEALTDLHMLERYGDLTSADAVSRAADQAIHSEARARFVATEANALAKATGSPKVLTAAAKEYGRQLVARLKIRNIKPTQYAASEGRAAKAAMDAMKANDLPTAAMEKRKQLLQHYAAKAAHDAVAEVEQGLRYLKKFNKDIKAIDPEYRDQIDTLLERFDLRVGQSLKSIDQRARLADWLAAQLEAGISPDIPVDLQNEAFRTSYKNLTLEAFRGLVDSVKQIEHLGRSKNKLLTAKAKQEYEAVRDEIVASVRIHSQGRVANTRTPTDTLGRAWQAVKNFGAAHIKVATLARVMDGGEDGGPMWEYFIRPANERADMETTMRAEATRKLTEIMAPVFKLGKMSGKGEFFASVNRAFNRQERMAIALNYGNEGNAQRLLDGEGWTHEQVLPILQSLTAAEWQAVQGVWDHIESYRPLIAEKERRVYGKELDWVDARALKVTTADGETLELRGGYYPVKYDPLASQRAEQHVDAEEAKRQLQGAYLSATTRRSFTKSRAEKVVGRPLLYSLAGVYSGVNDVIHDLAWHEYVIDVNKLLRSQSIDDAIRTAYGPAVKQQIKTWAQAIAEGEKGSSSAIEAGLSRVRQGVSAAGLGFNVMSAVMQPLGLTQSIVRVGAKWGGKGISQYIANPVKATRWVNEQSEFMRNRARTRFRELNELRNTVDGQTAFKEYLGRYAYFLMMRCQQMVDVPTWIGAYEKAVAEGNDEERAIALADQAVIDAQGGGQTKDQAAIERGGPAQKLFTVFYSFMNTALNAGVDKFMSADTPAKRARLAVDFLLLYTVPAVLGTLLKDALTPGGGDDEDLAKKLAGAQLDYLMSLMVLVREFGAARKAVMGESVQDYTGPAGVRLFADVAKLAVQSAQGEFDTSFRKAFVNTAGDLFGLPAAQINRTITGAQALNEGKTDNPAALVFGFR